MKEIIEELLQNNPPEMEWMLLIRRFGQLRLEEAPRNKFDLSFSQVDILSTVGMNPGCHLQDVATEIGHTPPSVSVSIRHLEKDGWLERRDDPNDGRASCFFITEKTKKAFRASIKYQMEVMKIFLKELDPEEQDQLKALLDKAITGMEAHQQKEA